MPLDYTLISGLRPQRLEAPDIAGLYARILAFRQASEDRATKQQMDAINLAHLRQQGLLDDLNLTEARATAADKMRERSDDLLKRQAFAGAYTTEPGVIPEPHPEMRGTASPPDFHETTAATTRFDPTAVADYLRRQGRNDLAYKFEAEYAKATAPEYKAFNTTDTVYNMRDGSVVQTGTPADKFSAYSPYDDVYRTNGDGTQTLVRKGVQKPATDPRPQTAVAVDPESGLWVVDKTEGTATPVVKKGTTEQAKGGGRPPEGAYTTAAMISAGRGALRDMQGVVDAMTDGEWRQTLLAGNTLTRATTSARVQEFHTVSTALTAVIQNILSGKQTTDAEYKRLSSMQPKWGDKAATVKYKLRMFRQWLDTQDRMMKTLGVSAGRFAGQSMTAAAATAAAARQKKTPDAYMQWYKSEGGTITP